MSTPSRPPASEAPRQFTVHLPPECSPGRFTKNSRIHFASSSTHLALGYKNSVWIYSLPAFDLVDTIKPGNLTRPPVRPLRIYERFLVVVCGSYDFGDFEESCFLYIWDLSARKHIGTVICNCGPDLLCMSVSLPPAETSEDGKLEEMTSEWPRDPVLIVALPVYGGNDGNLEIYVLHCPDAGSIEGAIENPQGPLPMTPATKIHSVPQVDCLASMGRTAVTGGLDCTVRTWDIIVGKCQMVFIGHTDVVNHVDLDGERIYSKSYDCTIRVWDRYKGDCLHVLGGVSCLGKIHVTPSHIIAAASVSGLFIWDNFSGKLEDRIEYDRLWDLGPIRGNLNERTLATISRDEDLRIFRFRTWDLISGQLLRASSFEPGWLEREAFFQGRCFIGVAKEDKEDILKIWDFGADDAEEGEVRDDDHGNSRDNSIDKIKEVARVDCGMSVSPSPSSSAVEGALASNSMVASKRKRSPTPDLFLQRKREKNDEHDDQVSISLT